MSYFANIRRGIKTTAKGMSLTLKHFWNARKTKGPINVEHPDYFSMADGHVTLQYPHETLSVPEIGRYQLDCEIDDCIVCDKCAKICPVDCIEIEAIKSPELIRYTSDGSPVRLHAAKFDIDMAKCCFCGLCTTVCPTECLVMNAEYDYSVVDVTQLNFAFSNLTEAEAKEKRELYDQFVAEKEAAKQNKPAASSPAAEPSKGFAPKFKPVMKPAEPKAEEPPKFVPKFQPKIKPVSSENENPAPESVSEKGEVSVPKFVPKFQPKIKPAANKEDTPEIPSAAEFTEPEKPKFVPKFQPKLKPAVHPEEKVEQEAPDSENVAVQKFVPKLKPKTIASEAVSPENPAEPPQQTEKPKVVFKPTLKPKNNS